MLDYTEETLDEITLAIEREITIALHLAIGLWRNHWNDCPLIERFDQPIGIVSLVADEGARISCFEQRFRAREIMVLPRRQHQAEGIAQGIDERVDFGA